MGFRGGGQIDPPPSVSWFSSTPAGVGLSKSENCVHCNIAGFNFIGLSKQ